ncbi:MAG: TRAP transporter small permease, partial [Syntrophomonadaceae bacterium]|nr:TRAP transporter small permease [Syntrophomonadaceae bacterium]
MKKANNLVGRISKFLDQVAGFCIALTMCVVVLNIILRVAFKHPLLGTIEYVNILTAVTIGLALANCAFQNGQIAVEFLVDKLPGKLQAMIDTLTNLTAFVFWSIAAWYMVGYAYSSAASGEVSATTGIPMYPMVYLVALGLIALCAVLFIKIA